MIALPMRWCLLVSSRVLLRLAGCGPQREATNDASSSAGHDEDRNDHDDHDDHDHHIPEHRPKDDSDAVRQLSQRIELVRSEARHPAHAMEEKKKLRDVITWLPELAADSDLKKPEWDRIHGLVKELDRLVPAEAPAFLEQSAPGSASRKAMAELIDELETIKPSTVTSQGFPLSPQSRSD